MIIHSFIKRHQFLGLLCHVVRRRDHALLCRAQCRVRVTLFAGHVLQLRVNGGELLRTVAQHPQNSVASILLLLAGVLPVRCPVGLYNLIHVADNVLDDLCVLGDVVRLAHHVQ